MGKVFDRVLQTTTSEGEGVIEMSGTVSGYNTWLVGAALATGSSAGPWLDVNYQIEQRDSNGDIVDWEIGVGTLYRNDGGNPYITRDTVKSSTNGGAKVDFGSGTKNIWNAPQAGNFLGPKDVYRRSVSKSGSFSAVELPGYDYTDGIISSAGFDKENSIALIESSLSEDYDAMQWKIIDDDTVRVYFANSPGSAFVHNWTFITGFPLVHHIIVDFGSGSSGANTLDANLGVTLNNYQKSVIVQNFCGNPYVPGDARLDQIVSLYLISNTQARLACHLNDAGNVLLSLSVIEF